MTNACDIINNQISQLIEGKDLFIFKKIDHALSGFQSRKNENDEKIGPNIICAVSNAIFFACAKAADP